MLLKACPKGFTTDLDKACSPEETVRRVGKILHAYDGLLAENKRIDTGRLGIPVYMSYCGPKALHLLPGRKQMGKGASAAQAQASAIMELTERYSFFAYWQDPESAVVCTWSEAKERFSTPLMPVEHILHSVGDTLDPASAETLLDLVAWRFAPVWDLIHEREVLAPVDWFKIINEYNGSCAGNTAEETILQGLCEVIERHVSAHIDAHQPELPSIDPDSSADPTLLSLVTAFRSAGIHFWLKDFSAGLPLPTVGALAYDPSTFPEASEIVFTAGTATCPAKAAIRALTEVAQLAGDFTTKSNYEASGLGKYTALEDCLWLTQGKTIPITDLPDRSDPDIAREIRDTVHRLHEQDLYAYAADMTHPELHIPAFYTFIAGCDFRERTRHPSLGLFIGRKLAEEAPLEEARLGIEIIKALQPHAPYIPFFQGLLALRENTPEHALEYFAAAASQQPDVVERALAELYCGYAASLFEDWETAIWHLERSLAANRSHAACNLRGVAAFKQNKYHEARTYFEQALDEDSGSAIDLANVGMCALHLGEPGQAMEYLQAALELDPHIAFAQEALAELLQP